MVLLKDYVPYVGAENIEELFELGSSLSEKTMVHVNATYYGGGVAEMLNRYVPLLNQAGLRTDWRLLKGSKEFFTVTKKMHNALQGSSVKLSKMDVECYESTLKSNSIFSNLNSYDCVVIDDPQPCGLIDLYSRDSPSLWKPLPEFLRLLAFQKHQPWVWRVHIDLSKPNKPVWNYLKSYVDKYDAVVVSHRSYARGLRPKSVFEIPPAIDPLDAKNVELSDRKIERILSKNDIDTSVPIISQISRFDPWKDPLGVIKAFQRIRKDAKCQLVLMGSMASDDPEGEAIFKQVYKQAEGIEGLTLITTQDDLLVNALQRKSRVVIQKSIREGFGLTVSEALWKGTPVVGGNVGGIPLQITDGASGYLVSNVNQCADRVLYLLNNPAKAEEMGSAGREAVRRNFLITRLVRDELRMCKSLTKNSTVKSLASVPKRAFKNLTKLRRLIPRVPLGY